MISFEAAHRPIGKLCLASSANCFYLQNVYDHRYIKILSFGITLLTLNCIKECKKKVYVRYQDHKENSVVVTLIILTWHTI